MRQLLLILCIMVFSCSLAYSQVFIENGKVERLVSPGDKISDSVTIDNTTGKSVMVKIYWEDFTYQSPYDGSKKFSPAGTLKSSLANWIKFSPRDVVLPPFAKSNISYVIDVPANVKGGYYGVLFVEPQNSVTSTADKGVRIITRVGSLFFIETADRQKTAALDQAGFDKNLFKSQLVNSGDVILLPELSYYVLNRDGLAMDRGQIKKSYLPPGAKLPVEIPVSKDLKPGDYTLILTFDLQDGDVFVKEVDFAKNSDVEYQLRTIRD